MKRAGSWLLLLALVALLSSCTGAESPPSIFEEDGLSFEVPSGWFVTGFSTTNDPHRLALTSYPVAADSVDGDCGGHVAVEQLPADGVVVVIVDYGRAASERFPPRPTNLSLEDGELAEFECFGRSTQFRFIVGGRAIQAHVGVGTDADPSKIDDALHALETISTS